MNEKLISGYAAYTTADEYGASATGNAPATTPYLLVASAVYYSATLSGAGIAYSIKHSC